MLAIVVTVTMTISCAISGCSSVNEKSNGISFFSLPKKVSDLNVWLENILRKNHQSKLPNNKKIKICHHHFKPGSFKTGNDGRRRLIPNAVPTVFPIPGSKPAGIESESSTINGPHHNIPIIRHNVITDWNLECIEKTNVNFTNEKRRFLKNINVVADQACSICAKMCYPNQVSTFASPDACPYVSHLPEEVSGNFPLKVCSRCKKFKPSKYKPFPSQAFWNNLDPGVIPCAIEVLNGTEKRLLSRIVPFTKVIKFDGRFGQYGIKGQAVLFATDVHEVVEQLPIDLPITAEEANIVAVIEKLPDANVTRRFEVDKSKLNNALNWLIVHNSLYRDVNNCIEHRDYRVEDFVSVQTQQNNPTDNTNQCYKPCGIRTSILRSSWNQGDTRRFPRNAGVQCVAMALASIAKAHLVLPSTWTQLTLDTVLLAGDVLYGHIKELHATTGSPIHESGFLSIEDLNILSNKLHMFNSEINFTADPVGIYGIAGRQNVIGFDLQAGLDALFANSSHAIFICNNVSLAVLKQNDNFYLVDSHSRGKEGAPTREKGDVRAAGKACVLKVSNLETLAELCMRNTAGRGKAYEAHAVHISHVENLQLRRGESAEQSMTTSSARPADMEEEVNQATDHYDLADSSSEIRRNTVDLHCVAHCEQVDDDQKDNSHEKGIEMLDGVRCSLMMSKDAVQPEIEDQFDIDDHSRIKLLRKTHNNIVNVHHEPRAEEFCWYFLLPYGRNGLNEKRNVALSTLDYFQIRILGNDKRFHRNDYLFYALSQYEAERFTETLNVCGKLIKNASNNKIEDLHLCMKKLRGTLAYWQTTLCELLSLIKCLGPPDYFLTFSCNDLHWPDMQIDLLVADGRPNVDPASLSIEERQRLVESFPVVVSRHFNLRINAMIQLMKTESSILKGTIIDYWYRIEYQNRGSPHCHMLAWVEGTPSLTTSEGIERIDEVVSCKIPEDDDDLKDLVVKCQMHHHTRTCYKNGSNTCRFGFPRKPSVATKVLEINTNDFVKNGGRLVLLRRNTNEKFVNNYNPTLLKLWRGNIDVQPCGSTDAIASYIAKYASKGEPIGVDESIGRTIQQLQESEPNASKRLYQIGMKILNQRQVSAAECAARLCHLPLKGSSRRSVYINSRKRDQRYGVLKIVDDNVEGYYSNIIDRYEKRPVEHDTYAFETMSLTTFAMLFDTYYVKLKHADDEDPDADALVTTEKNSRSTTALITLTDGSKMKIRNRPAAVRHPYYTLAKDRENYYYSLLLRYWPFRNETDLLHGFESSEASFVSKKDRLLELSPQIEQYRQREIELETAINQINALSVLEEYQSPREEIEVNNCFDNLTTRRMEDTDFDEGKKAMNVEQRELLRIITKHIQADLQGKCSEPLRIFITGGAGTGKTFTLKLNAENIFRCYANDRSLKIAALTGAAARLVNGQTVHSTFKLPVQKDGRLTEMPMLSGDFLKRFRLEWLDVKFIIIDEISMISYEILMMIDQRLKQIKNNDFLFGGCNVLLFGDLMQLPPVSGNPIYRQPTYMAGATHLWRMFSFCELTQNMRQKGDNSFIDLLNNLRFGELTSEQLTILGEKAESSKGQGQFSIDQCLRIYPTNAQVNEHNQKVVDRYISRGSRVYTIMAKDTLLNNVKGVADISKVISKDPNKTGGMPNSIQLMPGAKVMLRYNLNTNIGLVNGAMGTVAEIIWPQYRRTQIHEDDIPSLIIDFDDAGSHKIDPITIEFPANHGYGTVERRMLPVILSWASTNHKVQGISVDKAVLYLGRKLFAPGMAYVCLSRVRTFEGVEIEEIDLEKLSREEVCNLGAKMEIQRLRNITKKGSE